MRIARFIAIVVLLTGTFISSTASAASNTRATKALPSQADKSLLVLTERGGQHGGFTDAAMQWLTTFAAEKGYTLTEINDSKLINKEMLARHKVLIQLDYVPYG